MGKKKKKCIREVKRRDSEKRKDKNGEEGHSMVCP
jgi:hypothetical protein